MAINVDEVRKQNIDYKDLTDKEILDLIYTESYSDLPKQKFYELAGYGQEVKPPLTRKEKAKDIGMSLASGIYRGTTMVPGIAGDIEQLLMLAGKKVLPESMTKPIVPGAEPKQILPTSKDIRTGVEALMPFLEPLGRYQPQTTTGGYLQTVPEFAAPGFLAKTKAAAKTGVGLGAGGGAVYETVEQLTDSPGAATAVTIPSMIAGGFLAGPSKAATLAERATAGLEPKQIQDAIDLEEAARVAGIKLLPGETLDDKMVTQLVEDILKTDQGSAYIYEAIKNRPKEVLNLSEKQASKIADVPESQRKVFELIKDTASDVIKQAKITRTSESFKAGYGVSNDAVLNPEQVLRVINNIDDVIRTQTAPNSPNRAKLLQIRKQLVEKEVKVKGQKEKVIIPVTGINKLDSTFKQYRDAVNNSNKDIVVNGERFIEKDLRNKLFNQDQTGVLDELNLQMNTNPNYKLANQKYEELSKDLVNVVEKNILPLSKKNISLGTVKKLIFNPETATVKDINTTLKILKENNPEAVIEIGNIYLRNAINKGMQLKKQNVDLTQGFSISKAIAPTPEARKNFLAVIDNVADAHGLTGKDKTLFKVGFENMLDIFSRMGSISNINKPGFDVQGLAAQTIARDIAMAKTFNPAVRLSTKYSELKAGNAFDVLGRVIANPESTRLLVELGRTNPKSKSAIIRTVGIIDTVAPIAERQEQSPFILQPTTQ
jgi:hypothetical protein